MPYRVDEHGRSIIKGKPVGTKYGVKWEGVRIYFDIKDYIGNDIFWKDEPHKVKIIEE